MSSILADQKRPRISPNAGGDCGVSAVASGLTGSLLFQYSRIFCKGNPDFRSAHFVDFLQITNEFVPTLLNLLAISNAYYLVHKTEVDKTIDWINAQFSV